MRTQIHLKRIIKAILPFALSILILFFLLRSIELEDFRRTLNKVQPWILLFVIIFYIFIKLANTLRFSFLYKIKQKGLLFLILNYCNLILNIFPFRLGEISYVSEINKHLQVEKLKGLNKLIIIRFFDYITLYILFLISSLYVSNSNAPEFVNAISIFFFISLVLFAIFVFSLKRINKLKVWQNKRIFLLSKINDYLTRALDELNKITKVDLILCLITSLIYWTLRLFMGYIVFNSLGISLDLFSIFFITLTIQLIGLIPINTFANFGIFEFTGALLLSKYGYDYDYCITVFLSLHIITFIPVITNGIISLVLMKIFFSGRK